MSEEKRLKFTIQMGHYNNLVHFDHESEVGKKTLKQKIKCNASKIYEISIFIENFLNSQSYKYQQIADKINNYSYNIEQILISTESDLDKKPSNEIEELKEQAKTLIKDIVLIKDIILNIKTFTDSDKINLGNILNEYLVINYTFINNIRKLNN